MLIIFLLTLVPIRFIVLRDNYVTLLGKKKMSWLNELALILIFIIFSNIFVVGVGTFEKYLEEWDIRRMIQAFGGIFGVIISFCLPVINYVAVNGKRKIKSLIGYLITSIFIVFGVFSTYYSIYKIVADNEDEVEQKNVS